jgi:hypothetical protein
LPVLPVSAQALPSFGAPPWFPSEQRERSEGPEPRASFSGRHSEL